METIHRTLLDNSEYSAADSDWHTKEPRSTPKFSVQWKCPIGSTLTQGELLMGAVLCRPTVGNQSSYEVRNAWHCLVLAQRLAFHHPSAYLPGFYILPTPLQL